MQTNSRATRRVEQFRLWLRAQGNTIHPTKGQWEVLRWEGPHGDGHRILYTNKYGDIANTSGPDATGDWEQFQEAHHG